MSTARLFIISPNWKQPRWTSVEYVDWGPSPPWRNQARSRNEALTLQHLGDPRASWEGREPVAKGSGPGTALRLGDAAPSGGSRSRERLASCLCCRRPSPYSRLREKLRELRTDSTLRKTVLVCFFTDKSFILTGSFISNIESVFKCHRHVCDHIMWSHARGHTQFVQLKLQGGPTSGLLLPWPFRGPLFCGGSQAALC